jgi:hypothetical protein
MVGAGMAPVSAASLNVSSQPVPRRFIGQASIGDWPSFVGIVLRVTRATWPWNTSSHSPAHGGNLASAEGAQVGRLLRTVIRAVPAIPRTDDRPPRTFQGP